MNKVENVKTQSALGDVACYATNAAELLTKIASTLPVTPDGKVRVDFKTAVALLQAFWDAFKKAAKDCAGKEIEVPSSGFWNVARSLLGLVGIRL